MSVSGISSSNLSNYSTQDISGNLQQFKKEFQQLGEDLQSGNLSAAQQDFATLQQLGPQGLSNPSLQPNNPLSQAFQQLSQDLQSGNLSAAQQDYNTIQQDIHSQAAHATHHHHHGGGDNSEANEISQSFQELGQALQSGNLSSAQQIYSTLQQEIQQLGANSGSTTSSSGTAGVSVNA